MVLVSLADVVSDVLVGGGVEVPPERAEVHAAVLAERTRAAVAATMRLRVV